MINRKKNVAPIEKATYVRNKCIKTMKQILALEEKPESWLVENLLPSGQLGLLVAPSDVGKSIFCRQLAVNAVLKKNEFIGLKAFSKFGRVIYVSTEDMDYDWKNKIEKYPLDSAELESIKDNMLVITNFGDSPLDLIKILDEEIKHNPTDLVVIDVLTDVFTGELNSSVAIRGFLKPYKRIAEKYNTTFLFVHHVSKRGEVTGIHSKQNVLGSQAIEASMRSVLELRKDSEDVDCRILKITKGNYVPEKIKKQQIRLNLNTDLIYERRFTTQNENDKFDLLKKIIELHNQKMSSRTIEATLKKEGITISKSSISDHIKKYKDNQLGSSESQK